MCSSGIEEFAVADDATLLEGMRRAFDLAQIVAVHAENDAITGQLARQAVAEGRLSARDYLMSRPVIAELEAIQRAILFAWETDCALHIVHVSTARGAELVANAKAQGLNISCETCPHYLVLTEADLERLQALAKCAPPLRSFGDQAALWDQIAAGGIDIVASDHSAAPPEVKFGTPRQYVQRLGRHCRLPIHLGPDAHRHCRPYAPAAARESGGLAFHQRRAALPLAPGQG